VAKARAPEPEEAVDGDGAVAGRPSATASRPAACAGNRCPPPSPYGLVRLPRNGPLRRPFQVDRSGPVGGNFQPGGGMHPPNPNLG
jgi:hypothetical protein